MDTQLWLSFCINSLNINALLTVKVFEKGEEGHAFDLNWFSYTFLEKAQPCGPFASKGEEFVDLFCVESTVGSKNRYWNAVMNFNHKTAGATGDVL